MRKQLGSGYKVTPQTGGSGEKLKVSHGGMSFVTVYLATDDNATVFHVHGGGLIVARLVNEFGIARTVTAAIKESLGSTSAG